MLGDRQGRSKRLCCRRRISLLRGAGKGRPDALRLGVCSQGYVCAVGGINEEAREIVRGVGPKSTCEFRAVSLRESNPARTHSALGLACGLFTIVTFLSFDRGLTGLRSIPRTTSTRRAGTGMCCMRMLAGIRPSMTSPFSHGTTAVSARCENSSTCDRILANHAQCCHSGGHGSDVPSPLVDSDVGLRRAGGPRWY